MTAVSAKAGTWPKGFDRNTRFPWPLVRAEELVTLNYGKALLEKNRTPGTVRVYGTNGQCGWHDQPLVTGPGLILGRKGMGNLGVKWCPSSFWVIDTAYFVTLNTIELDLKFFYHLVNYIGLNHLKDGTSNPSLSRDTFYAQLLPLPPQTVQRRIAYILDSLDDKIELNRRMNETLEAMARAVFRSWFVDFEPVRAKAEGRTPDGLDAATVKLFPDKFGDSALGPVPMGWRVGCVADGFNVTMGQSPPGETYNETGEGTPFFQGRAEFGFRFPTVRLSCTAPTRFAERGDRLVSVRAPVGDVNMADCRCCIGRRLAAVRHRSDSRSFTFYSMRKLEAHFARFEAEGTVFGSINKADFLGLRVMLPPTELVTQFERFAFPLDQQIVALAEQSHTLATLRDALLPKLLSGEVEVK